MNNEKKVGERMTWHHDFKVLIAVVGSVVSVGVAALLLFRACQRSDQESRLAGSWRTSMNGAQITITYNKDHTVQMSITGSVTHTQAGRWTMSGNELTLQGSTGQPEIVSIKRLDGRSLVLGGREPSGGGQYREYERTLTRIQ